MTVFLSLAEMFRRRSQSKSPLSCCIEHPTREALRNLRPIYIPPFIQHPPHPTPPAHSLGTRGAKRTSGARGQPGGNPRQPRPAAAGERGSVGAAAVGGGKPSPAARRRVKQARRGGGSPGGRSGRRGGWGGREGARGGGSVDPPGPNQGRGRDDQGGCVPRVVSLLVCRLCARLLSFRPFLLRFVCASSSCVWFLFSVGLAITGSG